MGLTRVILSRELSLEEIEEIRNQVPDMEIEIFVHGALCMAYSVAACSLAISTSATRTRAPAPTPAAGSTTSEGKKMTLATSYTKYEPIPVQNVEPTLGIGAPTDKVFMIEEAQRPGESI